MPTSYATVINVPSEQPTIQAGIDAAVNGDTVLVAPGTYSEPFNFIGKSIKVFGAEGANKTTVIIPVDSSIKIDAGENEFTELRGFSITGDFDKVKMGERLLTIRSGSRPTVSHSIFYGYNQLSNGNVIKVSGGAQAHITYNLFHNNNGESCVETFDSAMIYVINNTFDHNKYGIHDRSGNGVVKNNIFTNNQIGAFGGFDVVAYNTFWNNDDHSSDMGSFYIIADPLYTGPDNHDYSLMYSSPCIDAGDPSPEYNDPNGTRNDIGAFPNQIIYPIAFNINLGNESNFNVVSHSPTFYWDYQDLVAEQVACEIQVGTDSDWTIAEMWSSGQVTTNDPFVVYAGSELLDGETYYLRVRLSNDINWGDWTEHSFSMNSLPSVPVPTSPLEAELVYSFVPALYVMNSTDPESDTLTYGYEIYADQELTQLIECRNYFPEQSDSTIMGPIPDLEVSKQYWWRAHCYDGFEYSDWSSSRSFIPMGGNVLNVPGEYETIQSAVNASVDGDMVIVAPGTYQEAVFCGSRNIRIVGSDGPQSTILQPPDHATHVPVLGFYSVNCAQFTGFTVSGGTGDSLIYIYYNARPLISDCIFTNFSGNGRNSSVIEINSDAIIERNLFFNNRGNSCIRLLPGTTAQITNNTFDRNINVIYSFSDKGIIKNNIVANSAGIGIRGKFDETAYNCVWGNTFDFSPDDSIYGDPGPFDIVQDPMFMYNLSGDYRLLPESPCIDGGDPGIQYIDSDGSRNDIGVYPFGLKYPLAVDLDYGPEANGNVLSTLVPEFFWSYYDTAASSQAQYEIEIGTDNDWRYVEVWSSGPVQSVNTYALYSGDPLNDHTVYNIRIRLHDGKEWGDWTTRTFRTSVQQSNSDWPMFKGTALHTGHNPDDNIRPPLERKWSRKLHNYYLSPISVAGDKILVVPHETHRTQKTLWCLDASEGGIIWQRDYGILTSTSQPSYGYGLVYVQVVDDPSYVDAVNINTGDLVWRSYYLNQWYKSHAPTVHQGKVMICGDLNCGIQTFNAYTGEWLWSRALFGVLEGKTDGWTPAAYGNEVFIFKPGWLIALDINNGAYLWEVDLVPDKSKPQQPTFSPDRFTVPAVDTANRLIYMAGGTTFHVVDMDTREVMWDVFGRVFGVSPTVYDGTVYTIRGAILRAYDGRTGDSLWAYRCPEYFISGIVHYDPELIGSEYYPIVANGHLYASSCDSIYAFDLKNYELVWTYPVAGHISIAHEQLYVSSWDGVVHAFGPGPTDVEEGEEIEIVLPSEFTLNQNYPNPFNASTRIDYSLTRAVNVKITIYNILGETVRELVDEYKPAGEYMVIWNGKDDHNITLASA
jgi:hypothetical protein